MKSIKVGRVDVYLEPRDAWVGVFDDNETVYVCPLPFLVIRYRGSPLVAGWVAVAPTLLFGLAVAGMSLPGWLVGVWAYLLLFGVLGGALTVRRRHRRWLAIIDEYGCGTEHCLYCCGCTSCARDRARAYGLGIGLRTPFGHRRLPV